MKNPWLSVVIPSAGNANRMNGLNKQLYLLGGLPIVEHSIRAFLGIVGIHEIIIVCRKEERHLYEEIATKYRQKDLACLLVEGGQTRQESVFSGIHACSDQATHVIIHDGARPMIAPSDIANCMAMALQTKAAAVGVPVKDTIKIVNAQGQIESTPPRHLTYAIQTPQIFERALYQRAMAQAEALGETYTDDCQLVENLGVPVYLSKGNYSNIKITTPEDIPLIEEIYRMEGSQPYENRTWL